jgi:hypothetical protein
VIHAHERRGVPARLGIEVVLSHSDCRTRPAGDRIAEKNVDDFVELGDAPVRMGKPTEGKDHW